MIPPNRTLSQAINIDRVAAPRRCAFKTPMQSRLDFLTARALLCSQRRNVPDQARPKTIVNVLTCIAMYFTSLTVCAAAETPKPATELRIVLLHAQHLGAHGMGYGEKSLQELATRIQPEDVPALIELLSHQRWRTAATFALASQCQASIQPTREAAIQHKLPFFEAQAVMDLIAGFDACSADSKAKAIAVRSELSVLGDTDEANAAAEAKEKAENDARIQRNGLKMTVPKQAASLTRQEREEVYHRSLKAMGIDESGPLTPQQRDLVDRLYRTLVLGEPSKPKPQ
jgi:hypothetical protein